MKILFVYDHKYPEKWKDGLWAALNLLEKDGFEIWRENLQEEHSMIIEDGWDFILGWGAFGSSIDKELQKPIYQRTKKGLCIGGVAAPPASQDAYDVLFYETEWYLPKIASHRNAVHAFGINADIYFPLEDAVPVWDWTTVGAFSTWKRQHLLKNKAGYKLAVGEIQKENLEESMPIVTDLLSSGVAVSDMVEPEYLARIYNSSEKIYIPADVFGGGERAVLEARACGRPVEVEYDNPKLHELTRGPVYDHFYYFDQLKKGILSCL